MYRILLICLLASVILGSCNRDWTSQLTSKQNRKPYFEPIPYGMKFIKQGSINIGSSEEEVDKANTLVKTVSVPSFWMDDTEITNNEYRQFVYWVRDSIARQLLSETIPEFLVTEGKRGSVLENPTGSTINKQPSARIAITIKLKVIPELSLIKQELKVLFKTVLHLWYANQPLFILTLLSGCVTIHFPIMSL